MRIIVVDDEISALQDFLKQIIVKSDVEYRFFSDDPGAILPYLAEHPIDGAFLDVKMPGIDGFSLAEGILKLQPDAKIVFLTGLAIKKEDVPKRLSANLIDVLYKPYNIDALEHCLHQMGSVHPKLHVTMFGTFDCAINGHAVAFSSFKSKELFALLLTNRGKTVTMNQAINALWPDKDLERAKKLYRDAVWRLRETLREINFECVNFGRAILNVELDNIDCDYFKYLANPGSVYYNGDFLPSYDWSLSIQNELDFLASKENADH